MTLPPPRSTLFPYTTLFRSHHRVDDVGVAAHVLALDLPAARVEVADDRTRIVFGRHHLDLHDRLRSEEHTSELQSRREIVCRLLLEKKKRRNELVSAPGMNF